VSSSSSSSSSSSFPSSSRARSVASRAAALLTRLFLPRGALPPEYVTFQALDTLQALCSYLRGVLTLHATLEGLGVGGGGGGGGGGAAGGAAAALAATLLLLLKEGAGHAASLVFAFAAAARLDAEVRAWRLFADVANDVGLTLELVARVLETAAARRLPTVVDGDGLWLLAQQPSLLVGHPACVLTPNAVEFKRLWDASGGGGGISYITGSPVVGQYIVVSGSSTTQYALIQSVSNPEHLLVSVNGVVQNYS
jgi:hypothetical protein